MAPKISNPADKVDPPMSDEIWPLKRIIPYARNARVHPLEQISLLAAILRKRGADQRIVVDENGVILKGHGRRLAAVEAGMETFPVTQRFGLTDQEKREIRIEDNKVTLFSGWNESLLQEELLILSSGGTDLTTLGFNPQIESVVISDREKKPSKSKTIFVSVPKRMAKKAQAAIVQALDAVGIEHNL